MQDSGQKLNSPTTKAILMESLHDESVRQVVKAASQYTEPRYSTITEIGIQRRANGPWYKVDVNLVEMLKVLQTGEYDEQPVTGVQVFNINTDDGDVTVFIYDFILLHTERNPWRML